MSTLAFPINPAFCHAVLDACPDAILYVGGDGQIMLANRRAAELLRTPQPHDLIGRHYSTFVRANEIQRAADDWNTLVHGGNLEDIEYELVCADGRPLLTRISAVGVAGTAGVPDGVVGVLHDLARERAETQAAHQQLEEQLRQAQKMEAVGRLAGGVAHDFNNILTVVLGYGELLLDNPELPASLRPDVQQIQDGALMAASLTRQLLAFSRRQIVQPQDLDLNSALRRLRSMLERVIGEDVQVVMHLSRETPVIRIDPGQLEQIVMNLAVNARDALPHGGVITVETSLVHLDREYASRHIEVEPGHHVMLAVSDNGVGMAPDVRTRIFEPFFTTKPAGKGTGLGLPIVYGIVKQNDGSVWVYSEPGLGTTIKIYFPARDRHASGPQGPVTSLRPVGSETILVVEDDSSTLDLARKGLEKFGYAVLTARNGEAALDLANSYPHPIELLVTDVIMPAMGGKELAAALAAKRPGIKVLYSSGYTDNAIVHHGVVDPGTEFLQKPYTPEVLARRVRQILDSRPDAERD